MMRRLLVVAVLAVMALACSPRDAPDVEPIALSLGLRPKPSCDLTPVQYTTDCLAAVELIVEPTGTASRQRTCVPLEGDKRFANLADLLTAEDPVIRFATLSGRGPVVLKVRGIHDLALGDEDPCDAATSSQHWLFWGESAAIDVDGHAADSGVLHVTISIDCRDCQGGCERLGTNQCPARMPPSYCVPFSSGFSCARRCDDDDECFEGAISCSEETGRCDPAAGEPGTSATGGFCSPCGEASDCDVGFSCVAAPNADVGLCTQDCPLNRCLSGATCHRLGANLVVLSGSSGITGFDAGPAFDPDGGTAP